MQGQEVHWAVLGMQGQEVSPDIQGTKYWAVPDMQGQEVHWVVPNIQGQEVSPNIQSPKHWAVPDMQGQDVKSRYEVEI